MLNDFENFREIIRSIITEENTLFLRKNNIFTSHTGMVTKIVHSGQKTLGEGETTISIEDPYQQSCDIDLIFTTVSDIINKTGEVLKVGDTVTLLEKYGSNFSNCFIAYKNGRGE